MRHKPSSARAAFQEAPPIADDISTSSYNHTWGKQQKYITTTHINLFSLCKRPAKPLSSPQNRKHCYFNSIHLYYPEIALYIFNLLNVRETNLLIGLTFPHNTLSRQAFRLKHFFPPPNSVNVIIFIYV